MTLPSYNFLPAPLWLITVLHVLTLSLHFLAMNFVLGGIVVLLFARAKDRWQDPAVQNYIKLLPSAVAATVTLGVAPLLFLQLVYYDQVYSASIVSAWPWLLVIAAVVVGYYLLYGAAFSGEHRAGRVPALLAWTLPLLLYVSLVYSTVFSMAERPEWYQALYAANQSGWAINTHVGAWIFRWLHMITGAVAVGGFFVGVVGRGSESVHGIGRGFFLWGMVTAMLVGGVYLMTLGDYLRPLMRSAGIWFVLVSLVLSLGALHLYFKKRLWLSGIALAVSLIGMVATRHVLRLIVLEGKFDPSTIPVSPQWSVFVLFLVCFVLAISLVAYMLKAYFGAGRKATT